LQIFALVSRERLDSQHVQMNASIPSPNQIVTCVLDAWSAGANDEVVATQLMQLGLPQNQALNALELVRSGFARAAFIHSGLPAHQIASDMDDDPIFRIAMELGQLELAKIEPEANLDEANAFAGLQSADVERRRTAAYQLGQCKNPDAVRALLSALGDPDTYVRVYAIQSLATIGSQEAVKPLCALLSAVEPNIVLTNVINAMARIGGRDAVPALIAATKHEDAFVRHDAAWALGELDDDRAIPALTALLHDETVPIETDEFGLTTQTSIYSVARQAQKSLARLRQGC
jgi:HEAT repeat protein